MIINQSLRMLRGLVSEELQCHICEGVKQKIIIIDIKQVVDKGQISTTKKITQS